MFYSIIYSIIPYVIVCFNVTPSVIVHFIVTPCFEADSRPIVSSQSDTETFYPAARFLYRNTALTIWGTERERQTLQHSNAHGKTSQ